MISKETAEKVAPYVRIIPLYICNTHIYNTYVRKRVWGEDARAYTCNSVLDV